MKTARKKNTREAWLGFLVRFFIGAVAGAVIGLVVWARCPSLAAYKTGIFILAGTSLFIGILSGVAGDKIWREWYKTWFKD